MNHLPAKKKEISEFILMPGDPSRVDKIGKYLDGFKIIGQSREFRIGNGFYRKLPVTVVSTGIGCPSTAIAAEELIEAGAKYLVRVGTCGGAWRKNIKAGSLIIPTACVRDEGTTREYIPAEFPAVADPEIVFALLNAAKNLKFRAFTGINRTHDSFYGSQKAILRWAEYLKDDRFKKYETPILSSDMESAALFVIASLKNVKAGAVLAVNSNPESLKARVFGKKIDTAVESAPYITSKSVDACIKAALTAFLNIYNKSLIL